MAVAWITADELRAYRGIAAVDAADDAWIDQATAAANALLFRRRATAGYVDDEAIVPDDDVHAGTLRAASNIFLSRNFAPGSEELIDVILDVKVRQLCGIDRPTVIA